MKKIVFSILLLSFSMLSFGQLEEKMKAEGVVEGVIIKKGEEIKGFIKKEGTAWANDKTFPAPWEFQDEIRFISEDDFIKLKKIKRKHYSKYGPKDCDGYIYDGQLYESVKYSDMSAVGLNMLPVRMFMHKALEDKISLYYFFETPPPVVSGPDGFEPYYIECGKSQLVYKIGDDGKLKMVGNMNVEKELADCPMVVEKFKNNEYKTIGDEDNDSKLNKFVNKAIFKSNAVFMAIEDYNKNCK